MQRSRTLMMSWLGVVSNAKEGTILKLSKTCLGVPGARTRACGRSFRRHRVWRRRWRTTAPRPRPRCEAAGQGGIFSFFISEPVAIDPWNAQESEGIKVVEELFDSLVAFDPLTSEIIPAVAETWEANADATVWTFNLGDSKFHNGRDVTAADFKYAWERICNPANEGEISYHLSADQGLRGHAGRHRDRAGGHQGHRRQDARSDAGLWVRRLRVRGGPPLPGTGAQRGSGQRSRGLP